MHKVTLAQFRGIKDRPAPRSFRLGSVDVRPESGTIEGPAGNRQLDPKVMQVLLRLVTANGEVVTREDLMDDVWRGSVVTDFALSRCIYQLRKNLRRAAGTADSPIETLPKRGFRLAWAVSDVADSTPVPARSRRIGRVSAVVALIIAAIALAWWYRPVVTPPDGRLAVAVLPFYDLTGTGDLGYFGDGVAQALMTELGRLREIDVIARTSSFHFRDRQADTHQIAQALDVDFLVEGSVNSDRDAVQVTAALVDTTTGRQLWSGAFEGVAGQSFTAQQDIADAIAGFLEISIGDPRSHGGTTVFEAYDAYLKSFDTVNLVRDDGSGDLFLDQALAYDPDFAHALEAKAFLIYLRLWQGNGLVEQAWNEARPYLERALEINDRSAFAHGTIAGFQIFRDEYDDAESHLQQALEINPSDTWALVHLSRLMEHTGRLDQAVRLARHNARIDPLNPFRHIQLANRLWTLGEIPEATASFERAIELDPLNYAGWRDYCLRLANREGELAAFRLLARLQQNPEFRQQFVGATPQLAPAGLQLIARWLSGIGDLERERELLELESRLGDNAQLHRELGWSHLARGDTGRAWDEAWLALEAMPRDDIANFLAASIALRSGFDPERVLAHYRTYWPGLFRTPPEIEAVGDLPVISAALLLSRRDQSDQGVALLEQLAARDGTSSAMRAVALAHLGQLEPALEQLEAHVQGRGFFSYRTGDPFWQPLVGEPRFDAVVEAEAEQDALAREQLALMIERGELVLPGSD